MEKTLIERTEFWLNSTPGNRNPIEALYLAEQFKLSPSLIMNFRCSPNIYERHLAYYLEQAVKKAKKKKQSQDLAPKTEGATAPQGHPIYYTIKLPKFTMLWLKIKTFFQCLWKLIRSLFASAQ